MQRPSTGFQTIDITNETLLKSPISYQVAHSLSGRLRIRIPSLTHSKDLSLCEKQRLASLRGVRKVSSNHHCGSFTIHYDPKITKEKVILEDLACTRVSDLMDIGNRTITRKKGISGKTRSRLRWAVATVILTVIFSDTLFPLRILLYVMIVFISIPIYQRAYETAFKNRRFDLDLLNAFAMTLGLLADNLVVTAVMALLIYLGDYINERIASGSSKTLCMLMGENESDEAANNPNNRHLRLVIGLGTLTLGTIMLPLPGPGLVIIPIGLGMLAKEREWAKRLNDWFNEKLNKTLPQAEVSPAGAKS